MRLLAGDKADLDAKDNDGTTAAIEAATYGQEACLRLLAEAVADLDAKDNDSRTAAILAARCGKKACNEVCLRVLAEAKADLDVKDNEGCTALDYKENEGNVVVDTQAWRDVEATPAAVLAALERTARFEVGNCGTRSRRRTTSGAWKSGGSRTRTTRTRRSSAGIGTSRCWASSPPGS